MLCTEMPVCALVALGLDGCPCTDPDDPHTHMFGGGKTLEDVSHEVHRYKVSD